MERDLLKMIDNIPLRRMRRRFFICVLMLPCLLYPALAVASGDMAFWVWHRHDSLSKEERQALASIPAALFWQVGEISVKDAAPTHPESSDAGWLWREALPEAGAIPVVRLNVGGLGAFQKQGLIESLAGMADTEGRLQIDCDCPDRQLMDYARFLEELHKRVPHLSATALAGWSGNAAFGALQESVEELDVMFYDLLPDAPNIGPMTPPFPLLDSRTFTAQLASWQHCKVPWRAGLPNFSRVTVFDASGRSLGQIRNWTWNDILFQPHLKFLSAPGPGLILMKAEENLVIAETPIKAGSFIAVRQVDGKTLRSAMAAVRNSPAKGPVFFRLPDSTDPSGWSVSQLGEWMKGAGEKERLELRNEGACMILTNTSPTDLPPHLDGDKERGYALEVDAPVQLWREAIAGDFWKMASHADPEKTPEAAPVPLSTRLTFWFGSLRAGESLKTGLIQLAPDADIREIRYRILPEDTAWKPLK